MPTTSSTVAPSRRSESRSFTGAGLIRMAAGREAAVPNRDHRRDAALATSSENAQAGHDVCEGVLGGVTAPLRPRLRQRSEAEGPFGRYVITTSVKGTDMGPYEAARHIARRRPVRGAGRGVQRRLSGGHSGTPRPGAARPGMYAQSLPVSTVGRSGQSVTTDRVRSSVRKETLGGGPGPQAGLDRRTGPGEAVRSESAGRYGGHEGAPCGRVQMPQSTPNPEDLHPFKHPARVSPTSRNTARQFRLDQ